VPVPRTVAVVNFYNRRPCPLSTSATAVQRSRDCATGRVEGHGPDGDDNHGRRRDSHARDPGRSDRLVRTGQRRRVAGVWIDGRHICRYVGCHNQCAAGGERRLLCQPQTLRLHNRETQLRRLVRRSHSDRRASLASSSVMPRSVAR